MRKNNNYNGSGVRSLYAAALKIINRLRLELRVEDFHYAFTEGVYNEMHESEKGNFTLWELHRATEIVLYEKELDNRKGFDLGGALRKILADGKETNRFPAVREAAATYNENFRGKPLTDDFSKAFYWGCTDHERAGLTLEEFHRATQMVLTDVYSKHSLEHFKVKSRINRTENKK